MIGTTSSGTLIVLFGTYVLLSSRPCRALFGMRHVGVSSRGSTNLSLDRLTNRALCNLLRTAAS